MAVADHVSLGAQAMTEGVPMAQTDKHKWAFPPRFRAGAYGWKASTLACGRVRQAVAEIQRVASRDPVLASDGAVRLLEKLWPALQGVDTSSGALGAAVNKAVDELVAIMIAAPADAPTRRHWLDRLWQAMAADGVDYLAGVGARWGELCGTREVAAEWGADLLPTLRLAWSEEQKKRPGGYFRGATACLSCMITCGRYEEVLELVAAAPYVSWHYRRYGVDALLAMGRPDEAMEYVKASRGPYDFSAPVAAVCEKILLAAGRTAEAYRDWALAANQCGTHLATFRAVAAKYPDHTQAEILADLIKQTPGDEGRWFATAKSLNLLDLAADLARRSPCEPKTLNRAARDHLDDNPRFALDVALASLQWIARGHGYEITAGDVLDAHTVAAKAAKTLDLEEEAREQVGALVRNDRSEGRLLNRFLAGHGAGVGDSGSPPMPTGDCYRTAYEMVEEIFHRPGASFVESASAFLVHGTIVPPSGPHAGSCVNHAWVESHGQVIDPSDGRDASMPRDRYYEAMQAHVFHRYFWIEAMKQFLRTGHWGPWQTRRRSR